MYLTGGKRVNDVNEVKQAKVEHGLYWCCIVKKRPRACKRVVGVADCGSLISGPGVSRGTSENPGRSIGEDNTQRLKWRR